MHEIDRISSPQNIPFGFGSLAVWRGKAWFRKADAAAGRRSLPEEIGREKSNRERRKQNVSSLIVSSKLLERLSAALLCQVM
jgi:hypothetical protein